MGLCGNLSQFLKLCAGQTEIIHVCYHASCKSPNNLDMDLNDIEQQKFTVIFYSHAN